MNMDNIISNDGLSNVGLAITKDGLSKLYQKSENSKNDDSYLIACFLDEAWHHFSLNENHLFIWEKVNWEDDKIAVILTNYLHKLDNNQYLFIQIFDNKYVMEKGNYLNNDFGFSYGRKFIYNESLQNKKDVSSQLERFNNYDHND